MGVCTFSFCNVLLCVCVGFVMSCCVYVWLLKVWVCVFVGFVMLFFVFAWVL